MRILVAVLAITGGCYTTTRAVPREALGPLAVYHADEFVVGGARVGPNSDLRFRRLDGSYTEWSSARKLRVSRDGVFLAGGDALAWSDVEGAEIANLNGALCFGGIILAVATTVALIPLALALHGGGGNLIPTGNHLSRQGERSDGDRAPILTEEPRFLFGKTTRRRGWVQFVPTLELGADPLRHDYLLAGAALSLRIVDALELGAGARSFTVESADGRLVTRAGGFFRLQGHLDLDARRRAALVLGLDAGGSSSVTGPIKLDAGVRVRVNRRMFVGVYPFNPSYTNPKTATHRASHWSTPTTVEAGWAL